MIGYRIVVVLFLAAFTACITCSILFPIFRTSVTDSSGSVTTITYSYWYVDESAQAPNGMWSVKRFYTRDLSCKSMAEYYTWAASLSVAVAGLGGLATLLGAAWVSVGYSVGLSVIVFLLTLLSFACAGTVVGLMGYAYCKDFCGTSDYTAVRSPQASGFNMVEGFILLCVAAGGFAILLLMQAIGFCCGCQTGKRVKPHHGAPRVNLHEPIEERDRRAPRPAPQQQQQQLQRQRGGEARHDPRVVVAQDAEWILGEERRAPVDTEGYYPYPMKN